MKRPLEFTQSTQLSVTSRSAYTLVEMLVATALTMVLMGAVVTIFGSIGRTVSDSRSVVESCDRLRAASIRLQMDLDGATATGLAGKNPDENGYLQIIEGPVGRHILPSSVAINKKDNDSPDYSVTDFDDILMFTTHGKGVGFSSGTIEADFAEVIWFVQGNKLYRHVVPVVPGNNTLADLALRTNRYAGGTLEPADGTNVDFWENTAGAAGGTTSSDLVLTNVIGFDVKVWDPLAQMYVDLGGEGSIAFSDANRDDSSGLANGESRVYDTWSMNQRQVNYGTPDLSTDGFDNNGIGGIDDSSERQLSPPYAAPLRGIKVEIRIFEPSSRQIRVVNVVGEFLPK